MRQYYLKMSAEPPFKQVIFTEIEVEGAEVGAGAACATSSAGWLADTCCSGLASGGRLPAAPRPPEPTSDPKSTFFFVSPAPQPELLAECGITPGRTRIPLYQCIVDGEIAEVRS